MMYMLNIAIFRLRSPLTLGMAVLTPPEVKVQSRILWIHDKLKWTIAWGFETKENYNDSDNKQHEWKSAQHFPELRLKTNDLKMFQWIWTQGLRWILIDLFEEQI